MAESPKKQRKSNFSQEEIETIVRAVRENYDTLYGTYAKKAVNKSARHKVWSEVTKEVNQVSYEKRTLQEVKNKWKKCQHLYRMDDAFNDNSIPDSQNVWEPLTELDDDEGWLIANCKVTRLGGCLFRLNVTEIENSNGKITGELL